MSDLRSNSEHEVRCQLLLSPDEDKRQDAQRSTRIKAEYDFTSTFHQLLQGNAVLTLVPDSPYARRYSHKANQKLTVSTALRWARVAFQKRAKTWLREVQPIDKIHARNPGRNCNFQGEHSITQHWLVSYPANCEQDAFGMSRFRTVLPDTCSTMLL